MGRSAQDDKQTIGPGCRDESSRSLESLSANCVGSCGERLWRWPRRRGRRGWLPTHGHRELRAELVGIIKLLMSGAVLVHQPGDFYVITTILGNLCNSPFLEPPNGLQSFGGLFDSHRCMGY